MDQPCEDSSRVRVSGPFTVESLSPHRVLSSADENLNGSVSEQEAKQEHDFVSMILDNLRKAGVQNTMRKERLTFERLESFAGVYLQATGEYLEEGKRRRCAIHIGPEHGTVGPVEVKEAAKEAVQFLGYPECNTALVQTATYLAQAHRLWVCLRSSCRRGGEAIRQTHSPHRSNESRSCDGR